MEYVKLVEELNKENHDDYRIVIPVEKAPKVFQTDNSKKRGYVVVDWTRDPQEAEVMLQAIRLENPDAYVEAPNV